MNSRGYDLIGDVHGCARTLEQLLLRLGYSRQKGCYRHPQRQAVFLGDIVDRGNFIRESLHIVREMVDAGVAHIVIGNHEYNAIAYCTKARPEADGDFLRIHNERHERQIRESLEQFSKYPDEWREFLLWFRNMPLFLEFDAFRVIHACWDQKLISELKQQQTLDFSDDDMLHRSAEHGGFEWQVADRLLRGTYLPIPNNESMTSEDGYHRRVYRTQFWSTTPEVHNDVVFQPDPLPSHIGTLPLSASDRKQLLHYAEEEPPLFIGHYWRKGAPESIRPNIACLDYSAVKQGKLVAYRMDSETQIDRAKFVWVDVDPDDIQPTPPPGRKLKR